MPVKNPSRSHGNKPLKLKKGDALPREEELGPSDSSLMLMLNTPQFKNVMYFLSHQERLDLSTNFNAKRDDYLKKASDRRRTRGDSSYWHLGKDELQKFATKVKKHGNIIENKGKKKTKTKSIALKTKTGLLDYLDNLPTQKYNKIKEAIENYGNDYNLHKSSYDVKAPESLDNKFLTDPKAWELREL